MARKKLPPARKNDIKVSLMQGGTKPIIIECWDKDGKKVVVRTDAIGAHHVSALLLKNAMLAQGQESTAAGSAIPEGYERVRRDGE